MANKYQHRTTNSKIPNAIGLAMIVFGGFYVVMAAILLSDVNLSISYARPVLDELGEVTQEELILWAIVGDITFVFAGVFGIVFGYGILKMKKWSWLATVIYNIIFTLLCIDAFANNALLPDSYLVVVSVGLLVLLFRPATRAYFREAQVIQK